jgi:hypothetical protein
MNDYAWPEDKKLPDDRIGVYYRIIFNSLGHRRVLAIALPSLAAAQRQIGDAAATYAMAYLKEYGGELTRMPGTDQLRFEAPAEILEDGRRVRMHLPDHDIEFVIEEDTGDEEPEEADAVDA